MPEKVFPGIWQSLALVFAVLALDILVLLLLKRWGLMDAGGGMVAETAGIVVSNGLVTAVFLARRGLTLRNVLHPNPASARAVTGLLAVPVLLVSPAIFLASSIVDDLLELAYPMSDWYRRMFEEMLGGGAATVVALLFVGPFFEELLFRGIVLRGLLARMPAGRAIVISSLIFGAAHLNVYQFVGAGLLGLPLGWLYARFRSIWPCMLLHAAQNLQVLLSVLWLGKDAQSTDVPPLVWAVAALACVPAARFMRALLSTADAASRQEPSA